MLPRGLVRPYLASGQAALVRLPPDPVASAWKRRRAPAKPRPLPLAGGEPHHAQPDKRCRQWILLHGRAEVPQKSLAGVVLRDAGLRMHRRARRADKAEF